MRCAEGSCNPGGSTCADVSESKTATLSCPSGQAINSIKFASYGTPAGSCSSDAFTLGTCNAATSVDKVKAACLNKSSCAVVANNAVFGEPCSGTPKKLAVTWTCAAPTVNRCVTAIESSDANLTCPTGEFIRGISFASYGQPAGACPTVTASTCHSASSASQVRSLCLNKPSCTIAARNSAFGDPCMGKAKKLAVVWACGK